MGITAMGSDGAGRNDHRAERPDEGALDGPPTAERRLRRSGARPLVIEAAHLCGSAVETPLAGADAIVRHEVDLYLDRDGCAHLHLVGRRRDAADAEAPPPFETVISGFGRDAMRVGLDAYDPARLVLADDPALFVWSDASEAAWREFADAAQRVKFELVAKVGALLGLDLEK